jgi:hypothetical protein
LWPLWAGVAASFLIVWRHGEREAHARAALVAAGAGGAWIGLVAAMAEAGFSGEPRYALPGAALISLAGAVGLVLGVREFGRAAPLAAVLLVAPAAVPRLADLPALRSSQAYQWRLAGDLGDAVTAAGGREAVLNCGRPYVGHLRGPLLAYRIGVAKHVVEPDDPPRPPGVVFLSALNATATPAPTAPQGFTEIARSGTWRVLAACRVRASS